MDDELDLEPAGVGEKNTSAIPSAAKLNELTLECLLDEDAAFTMSSNGSDSTAAVPRASGNSTTSFIQQLMARAEVLFSRNRCAETLVLLRPVLAKRPQHPDALCLQASCLMVVGNKAQALASYAGALVADPHHVRALLGCAALHKESGLLQDALVFLEKAYAITSEEQNTTATSSSPKNKKNDPNATATTSSIDDDDDDDVDALSSSFEEMEAVKLHAQVSQALAVVLTDLATQAKINGRSGWKEYYKRAVSVAPSYSPAHYNLGVAATEEGDQKEALKRYGKAVELEPLYAEAWCNIGVIRKATGDLEKAIDAYEDALAAGPNLEMVKVNLAAALTEKGTVLKSRGDIKAGIKAYERAVALIPRHAEALYNLGVAYSEERELDKSVFMYEMAIAAAPHCAEAHNNLGVIHRERGNFEAAVKCYEAALIARPNFPEGLNNLAVIYTQQGQAADALNMLHAALMAKPDYAEAFNNLGVLQREVGDAAAAVESYQRCLDIDPDNRNANQNRLLALNYIYHGEQEFVCAAHAAWGQRFQQIHPQLPLPPPLLTTTTTNTNTKTKTKEIINSKTATAATVDSPSAAANGNNGNSIIIDTARGLPLVVGYVSPDLFLHSVSYFAEAPLRHHNPACVKLIVYSVCAKPDCKTERLAAAVNAAGGTWRDVARLTEEELALMILQDGVQILVELTGHTANNRLGTFARRPAPVQLTWIGYPNSTGLTSIDYRLTDAVCDPVGSAQTHTEQLIRLPGCFLCYTPAPDAPPVAPLPALRNGFITFGSFNALAKETPEVLAVWARLLRSIPSSRLVLKNKPFACEAVQQQFWTLFENEGVPRQRIDLLPLAPATKDHLSQYSLMDICLDPWPYAGTTTTAEALFMGVPCLTLSGACHAHNVGVSLLTAVGLAPQWVANDQEEYVMKGQLLSQDVGMLCTLRSGLRQRMLRSALCDAPRFVGQLEETYRELWQRWVTVNSNDSSAAAAATSSSGDEQ